MADNPSYIPKLLGIILDTTGVAKSQVVAINRTTRDRQIKSTDANKVVIFDAAEFTSGYSDLTVIEFENVGASRGGTTITINSAGGFQDATITCAVASTTQVVL